MWDVFILSRMKNTKYTLMNALLSSFKKKEKRSDRGQKNRKQNESR